MGEKTPRMAPAARLSGGMTSRTSAILENIRLCCTFFEPTYCPEVPFAIVLYRSLRPLSHQKRNLIRATVSPPSNQGRRDNRTCRLVNESATDGCRALHGHSGRLLTDQHNMVSLARCDDCILEKISRIGLPCYVLQLASI